MRIPSARPRQPPSAGHAASAEISASGPSAITTPDSDRSGSDDRREPRDRVITASPCVAVRRPSGAPASTLQVLTSEQVMAFADAVPLRYRALVFTGAGTGLRPGELFGLDVGHVQFLRRVVRVDQQLARLPGGGVGLAPPKTPASYRSVPLPDTVAAELTAHIAEFTPKGEPSRLIFTTSTGGPVQQQPWASVWKTAPGPGGAARVGDPARSQALLRQRVDPFGRLGEGRTDPPRARLGEDDARHVRALVPRRGGSDAGGDRRSARRCCVGSVSRAA